MNSLILMVRDFIVCITTCCGLNGTRNSVDEHSYSYEDEYMFSLNSPSFSLLNVDTNKLL